MMTKLVVFLSKFFLAFLNTKALVFLILATLAAPARALCPQFCQVGNQLQIDI